MDGAGPPRGGRKDGAMSTADKGGPDLVLPSPGQNTIESTPRSRRELGLEKPRTKSFSVTSDSFGVATSNKVRGKSYSDRNRLLDSMEIPSAFWKTTWIGRGLARAPADPAGKGF